MPLKRDASLIPLSHDHHHGLVRVFEIREALRHGHDRAAQAAATRDFFDSDLRLHFQAEEEVVFPLLDTVLGAGNNLLRKLRDEHRRLREMIDRLDESAARLTELADLLERHIRCEERELFPLYQERVGQEQRDHVELGVRRILNRFT